MHFISQIIDEDLSSHKHKAIVTRFPPEPNGYLHVGHAKSICLNFGLSQFYNGRCHLRFDDTNPCNEEEEYVEAIKEDVRWLGFEWDLLAHSSDYYEQLFEWAVYLIKKNLAYVDSLTAEEIKSYRGTLIEPGKNSPYRERSVEENLDLFQRMRKGEFPEGAHVLRAKIDMTSGNINLRDPVLYRIRHVPHQRTGDTWCIYPMYDYAHPLSDAIEEITHSLCTLEFQDHRPLYDWLINHIPVPAKPVQIEFARLNLSHTVMSKRKLKILVEEGHVTGWDDPRLPTIRGMRKRGYPAKALRVFCEQVGISKADSVIDMSVLESSVRDTLNETSYRALCVLDPLKIIIENFETDEIEWLSADNHPKRAEENKRNIPFTKEIYIERSDFMENPPKGYFRLALNTEVRLRHAYIIKCHRVIYDEAGKIIALHATYDKNTLGVNPTDRKVKGVVHWVSATTNHPVTIIQYDRLFIDENPGQAKNFLTSLNPHSLIFQKGIGEISLKNKKMGEVLQFERLGYYAVNEVNQMGDVLSYHRVVDLKDTWAKLNK